MNYLDELDYYDFKNFNKDNYNDNILELRTLSKTEFKQLLRVIEKTIKEARKNKQ